MTATARASPKAAARCYSRATAAGLASGTTAAYTFAGRDILVFHAYDASDEGKSKLQILELKWDTAGWPSVDANRMH